MGPEIVSAAGLSIHSFETNDQPPRVPTPTMLWKKCALTLVRPKLV